jgi:HSP20 family protein
MADSATIQPAKAPAVTAPPKPAPKDNPSDPITDIYNSIARRAFEIFESNGSVDGNDMENWLQAESELLHPVHINVSDDGNSINVRAEVPGFTTEDLEVSVEPECLTITGKRERKEEQEKEGKQVYIECSADEILRVIPLPTAVDTDKATATLRDGVLELNLPKAVPPKTIKVQPIAA